MDNLKDMTRRIVENRLETFFGDTIDIEDIFLEPEGSFEDLARSAMGVTRTMGYALQRAWNNALAKNKQVLTRSDIMGGIKGISLIYLGMYLGAVKSGTLPSYQGGIWYNLQIRAHKERQKSTDKAASHFHVLPKREMHLSKLSEYLIIHLLKKARTTKKDTTKRNLYVFDYGICHEFGFGFSTDKNIVRQQRFVYDNEIEIYDKEFDINFEVTYLCKRCQVSFTKDQLYLEKLDYYLDRCPKCHQPLEERSPVVNKSEYTEEESKIIGSIYSDNNHSGKLAYEIADEVGCSTQKVAKFAEKLERQKIVIRDYDKKERKYRYLSPDQTA